MGKETESAADASVAADACTDWSTDTTGLDIVEGDIVSGPKRTFTGTVEKIVGRRLARVETDDVPGGVVFIKPSRLKPTSNAGQH